MTHKEFISTSFGKHDRIVVKQYLHHLNEEIVTVDFMDEKINGYPIALIEQHIIPKYDEENKQSN